jgi:hypothetical protein
MTFECASSSVPTSCACGLSRRSLLAGFGAAAAGVLAKGPDALAQAVRPKRIDVHFHYVPPQFAELMTARGSFAVPLQKWSVSKSLEDMDEAGVTTSIGSVTTPGVPGGVFNDAELKAIDHENVEGFMKA